MSGGGSEGIPPVVLASLAQGMYELTQLRRTPTRDEIKVMQGTFLLLQSSNAQLEEDFGANFYVVVVVVVVAVTLYNLTCCCWEWC